MQAYPRQAGLPRPYNLQFKNPKQQYPIFKYLNTPMKRFMVYFLVLFTLGGLIYIGTSDSRLREEDRSHSIDNEKLELLKANKLTANLEGDMIDRDDKAEVDEKNIIRVNQELVDNNNEVRKPTASPKVLQPAAVISNLI
ncbi:hypothetical protein WICPIJ_009082 [Wickerhamomyces pijperi]|uniref:Uncharacterized protein n=1 Tax=Wickerhamomyces pijperi TaxID=599730 RepID=A0A9P8PQN2_WICPI|nr:hypothetical protein WICPIJ_009082 [Wickerhamomyces pijperi]